MALNGLGTPGVRVPTEPTGLADEVVSPSLDTGVVDAVTRGGPASVADAGPSLNVIPDLPVQHASAAGVPHGTIPIPDGDYSVRGASGTYEMSRETSGDRSTYTFRPGRRGREVAPNAYGHQVLAEVDQWLSHGGVLGGAQPSTAVFVTDDDQATNMLALWRDGPRGGQLGGLRIQSPTGAIDVDPRVLDHLPPHVATRIFGPDATEYTQLTVDGEPMLAVGYTNADGLRSTMFFDAAQRLSFWETRLPDGRYRVQQGEASGQNALPNNFAAFVGAAPGDKVIVDYRDDGSVHVTPESGGSGVVATLDDSGNVVVNGTAIRPASIDASTSFVGRDELSGTALVDRFGLDFVEASPGNTAQRRQAFRLLHEAPFVRGNGYSPVTAETVDNGGDPNAGRTGGLAERLPGWLGGPWSRAIEAGQRGISSVVPGLDVGASLDALDSPGDVAHLELTAEAAFPTPWRVGGKLDGRRDIEVERLEGGDYRLTVEDRGRLRAVIEAKARHGAAGTEPGVEGAFSRSYTFGSREEVDQAFEYLGREMAEAAVNRTGPGVLGLGGLFGPSEEAKAFMESRRDSVAADVTGLLRLKGSALLPRRLSLSEELRLDPRAFAGAELSDGPPRQLTLTVGLSGEASSKAGPGIRSTRGQAGAPVIAPHRDDEIALELVYDLDASALNDPVAVLERLGEGAQPNAVRLTGRHRDYELLRDGSLPLLGRGDFDRAEWSLEARGAAAERISQAFLAGDLEGALVAAAESGPVVMTEYTDIRGSGTNAKPELKVAGIGVALEIEAGVDDVAPANVSRRQLDANELAAWVGQRFDPVGAATDAASAIGPGELPDEAYAAVLAGALAQIPSGGAPDPLAAWQVYMEDAHREGDLDRLERGFGLITTATYLRRHPVAPYMDRWLNGDGSELNLDYRNGGRLWRAPLGVQTDRWFQEQPNIAEATAAADADAVAQIRAGVANGSLPANGTFTLEPRRVASDGQREPLAYALLGQFHLNAEYHYRSTPTGLVVEPLYTVNDRWDMDPGRGDIERGDLLDHDWGVALQDAGRAQPFWVRITVPGEEIRLGAGTPPPSSAGDPVSRADAELARGVDPMRLVRVDGRNGGSPPVALANAMHQVLAAAGVIPGDSPLTDFAQARRALQRVFIESDSATRERYARMLRNPIGVNFGLPEVDEANEGQVREELRQRYYRYFG